MLKKIYSLLIIVLILSSCTIEPEEFDAKQGAADFTTTVFIGNSLTAGYRDGELYKSAQEESFPAIIAQSLNQAGFINHFKQPLMPGEIGFGKRLSLGYSLNCEGETSLGPVPYSEDPDITPAMASVAADGPFQNLGVPDAKVADLITPGYGSAAGNPYFARFASDPMNTILNEATAQNPTFTVMWIGNNDVLGYATSGGTSNPITDPVTFSANLETIVQTLSTDGAKGVLCNIPDVTSTAYFTTVPYYGLVLDADQAAALTDSYSGYNQMAQANGLDTMSFSIGPNPFIIEDTDPAYAPVGNIRQINPGELIILEVPMDSLTCYGMGSATAIPDEYVLTGTELNEVNNAVSAYNNSIEDIADAYGWVVTDVNGLLADIAQNGRRIGGKNYSIDFVTGGIFSLDGIHLTGNGNAIVANEIIQTINLHFGAVLPLAMVNNYTGIIYP